MLRIGRLGLRLAAGLAPILLGLPAAAATSGVAWEWTGLLVLEHGQSLPRGAIVHIAMIDKDCDRLELGRYEEIVAAPRRSVSFTMLAPAFGHAGHDVELTADITGPDHLALDPDSHFDLISHRWVEQAY